MILVVNEIYFCKVDNICLCMEMLVRLVRPGIVLESMTESNFDYDNEYIQELSIQDFIKYCMMQ